MSLRLPPLERTLRDRVREEVHASPGLAAEYRRRRRGWNWRLPWAAAIYVYLWYVTCVAAFDARSDLLLSHQSLLLTAVAGFLATSGVLAMVDARRIVLLTALPIPDHHLQWVWLKTNLTASLALAATTLFAQSYVASRRSFDAADAAAIALCVASQVALLLAIFQWVSEHPLKTSRRVVIAILSFGVLLLTVVAGMAAIGDPLVWSRGYSKVTLLCTPGGWANAAYYYGHFLGDPRGWLFALPGGLAAAYLVWSLRRPLTVHEVRFQGNNLETVLFEDGREWRAMRLLGAEVVAATQSNDPELLADGDIASTVAMALTRQIQETDRERSGRLESYLGRLLTRRQRAVLTSWSGTSISYDQQGIAALVALAGAVAFCYSVTAEISLSIFSVFAICIYCLTGALRARGAGYVNRLYPIGMTEPLYASVKVSLLLAPLWFAAILLGSSIVAMVSGNSLQDALVAAAFPFLYLPAIWSLVMLSDLALVTGFIRRWPFLLTLAGCLLMTTLAFTQAAIRYGEFQLHLAGIGLLTFSALLLWPWTWWAFNRGTVDFLEPNREGT